MDRACAWPPSSNRSASTPAGRTGTSSTTSRARGGEAWAGPDGVRAVQGRLLASLPADVPIAEFREELHAALRHLRCTMSPARWPTWRAATPASSTWSSRSWNPRDHGFRGARRADDVYVLDPAEVPWRLFWIVVAARLAVIEGAPS